MLMKKKIKTHTSVKKMNNMVEYAKCAAVRDQQIKLKMTVEEKKKAEEMKWHEIMLEDKKKFLNKEQEKDCRRHNERMEGAQIIRQQIAERERLKMLREEAKHKYAKDMLNNIALQQEKENLKQKLREDRKNAEQIEISKANEDAMKEKKRQEQFEKDEDAKIALYLKNKDARELEIEKGKEEQRLRREKEASKLREQQQKAMDNRGEIDEIRARRAQEKKEREWRKKKISEAENRSKVQEDLLKTREEQLRIKESQIAQNIQAEREEFERTGERLKQLKLDKQEDKIKQQKIKDQYLCELKEQIEKAKIIKKEENQRKSGGVVKMKPKVSVQRLLKIKEENIENLKRSGVPDKYLVDLYKFDVTKYSH